MDKSKGVRIGVASSAEYPYNYKKDKISPLNNSCSY